MKHKGIKKRTEPFVTLITRSTKGSTQNGLQETKNHHPLSHSIKALYVRVVRSS